MASGLPSASASLPSTSIDTDPSSATVNVSALADGASSTAVTLSDQLALVDTAPALSITEKPIDVLPNWFASGRNSRLAACALDRFWPSTTGVTPSVSSNVPNVGRRSTTTLAIVPSMSVPSSATGIVLSSLPLAAPATATGASLTAMTSMLTTPVATAGPLLTV